MSEPLDVNPPQLSASGDGLTTSGEVALEIGTGYGHAISGLGPFAGTDKFGAVFHENFDPSVAVLVEGINGVAGSLTGAGSGAADSATLFNTADQVSTDSVSP